MPAMDERSHRTERRTKSPHPNSLANLRLVQPGQPSLNPGETPEVPAEVREAAMALTPDAIRVLGEIMNDPKAPPATRVTAADKILDRALGRSAQSVEVKGEKRDLLEYSIADLVATCFATVATRSSPLSPSTVLLPFPSDHRGCLASAHFHNQASQKDAVKRSRLANHSSFLRCSRA